ncbi:protein-disulfide reductase DsbD [Aurantimonas sp. VKM B-3413]|uniref:protein-disulfide reductase DsbD n=1 Tax=Aurantimonas sp. VKM B-3413 TaxID=2779401 RepID=UPI001E4DC4D5|nr:protein-disulfide reductase DsbD [Aurantimonas sp. VKM B-3413]MCB8839768.1 protein-disulfide reductase DsbD [Aurantimonas sp. VKM B-3413]
MSHLRRTLAALILLALPNAANADPGKPLDVDQAFALSADRTPSGGIAFAWRIAEGTYLYRDRIKLETAGGQPLALDTPKGDPKDDPFFGPLEVYHHAASAELSAESLRALQKGATLSLTYQGCQDGGICYRPRTRTVDPSDLSPLSQQPTTKAVQDRLAQLSKPSAASSPWTEAPVTDVESAAAPGPGPVERPAGAQRTVSNLPTAAAPAASSSPPDATRMKLDSPSGLIDGLLGDGGGAWVIAVFFSLGLGLAFTPCVLPMYPILSGQLARSGERLSAARAFALSTTYVLAMAAAFATVGFAAAWSGQNLQMALQSEAAIILVSVLFVVLALSMFGLFELRLPAAWTNRVSGARSGRRGGLAASAGLGFTSALIVGPCITAPLAGGLLYIARTGDVGLGASALFALGLGQGVPLIAFGTLGAGALPKPGPWMTRVTQGFGFGFLALAVWMISRILPDTATLSLWSALLIGVGVFVGALDVVSPDSRPRLRLAKAVGVLAVLYGAILAVGAAAGGNDPLRPLAHIASAKVTMDAEPQFRQVASASDIAQSLSGADRPSLIYVTADWCVSCDVIKRDVFPDPAVKERMAGLQLLEVDVTKADPARSRLMQDLGVAGPPTMLFVDRNGHEVSGSRLIGEVSPRRFIEAADRAGGAS